MKSPRISQELLVAFIGGLSIFCGGATFVWFAPLAYPLQANDSIIPLTSEDVSWIFALFGIGNIITPIPSGHAANRWGRKPVLLAFGPMIALTWIILIVSRSKLTLYLLRTVQGMLTSVPYTVLSLYLAEISDAEHRGAVVSFFRLMWHMGMLYVYIVGSLLPYKIFTYAMLAPPALFTITFLWCPETPYFLIMTGRKDSAAKTLALLRGGRVKSETIRNELNAIEESVQAEILCSKGSWRDVFLTRVGLKALLLTQFVTVTYIMTGAAAIEQYVTDTVVTIGHSQWVANVVTVSLGILLVLVMIPGFFMIDALGRRPMLLISTGGCALSLFTGSVVLYLLKMKYSNDDRLRMLCYTVTILSVCFVTFGIDPIVPILQGELSSSTTRGHISGISAMNMGIFDMISIQLYQILQQNGGLHVVYFVYFVLSLLGFVVIYIFLPETKKKSFEEIQKIL